MTMLSDRREVLDGIDLELLFVEIVGPGRGRAFPCPNPAHAQTGRTPPVSIDTERGLWNCHRCEAGGSAVDLLVLARGVPVAEAFELLRERGGAAPPRPVSVPCRPVAVDHARPIADSEAVLGGFLERRGWRPDVAESFGLTAMATPNGPRIRFPFRSDGQVLTWQDRALTDRGPKYLAAAGRPLCVYAWDLSEVLDLADSRGRVVLVEGPPDAVALAHAFPDAAILALPGVNNMRACRTGATLAGLDVIVSMDNDAAGDAARHALTTELSAHGCRVAHLRCPDGVNDLDDWRRVLGCDDDVLAEAFLEHADLIEWVP